MVRLTPPQFPLQLWAAWWIVQLFGLACSSSVIQPVTEDLAPRRSRPSQVHLGAAAAEAVAEVASRRTLGTDRRPDAEPEVSEGNETEIFPTCMMACEVCFRDFRQVCLAYCVRGCADYCEERLSEEECQEEDARDVSYALQAPSTQWYAEVSFATGLLDSSARLCRASGINGCPERVRNRAISDTSPVYDPYHYRPNSESHAQIPSEGSGQHQAHKPDSTGALVGRDAQAQEPFGLRGSPSALRFRHLAPV
mmetsp:Transcript_18714/g.33850  ORF Transcript_18714/g.33850 Transcript_18714/m.33850 type:complete len:252 (+) Transcript_18714:81-836(+)